MTFPCLWLYGSGSFLVLLIIAAHYTRNAFAFFKPCMTWVALLRGPFNNINNRSSPECTLPVRAQSVLAIFGRSLASSVHPGNCQKSSRQQINLLGWVGFCPAFQQRNERAVDVCSNSATNARFTLVPTAQGPSEGRSICQCVSCFYWGTT